MDILSTGSGSQYLVVFYVFPNRFKLGLNCPAPVPPSGCSRGTASWNMDARYSGFRLPSYPAIQQLGLTCTANSLCVMIVFAVCECWKIMNNAQMILLSLLWPLPPGFTENFKRGVGRTFTSDYGHHHHMPSLAGNWSLQKLPFSCH